MRRSRWTLIALAAVVLLVVIHPLLLRCGYGILIVDQPIDDCRIAMLVSLKPECFDTAAQLIAEDSIDEILLVTKRDSRSVRIGAVPSFDEVCKEELISRGVAAQQVRTIKTVALTPHQMFRELDRDHLDGANLDCGVIATSRASRYFRRIIDDSLPAANAARYRVHCVPTKQLESSTWWHTRTDVSRVVLAGLRLAFVVIMGESDVDSEDPYESLLDSSESVHVAFARAPHG